MHGTEDMARLERLPELSLLPMRRRLRDMIQKTAYVTIDRVLDITACARGAKDQARVIRNRIDLGVKQEFARKKKGKPSVSTLS